mmetsp:Transcript_51611/g.102727  ORF Transcript_51611/g.102727 Transcript_51611/m.102727 type:complete len:103 (-) Transcript_51611:256-564(-)
MRWRAFASAKVCADCGRRFGAKLGVAFELELALHDAALGTGDGILDGIREPCCEVTTSPSGANISWRPTELCTRIAPALAGRFHFGSAHGRSWEPPPRGRTF